jgi:hypothetical protein
VFLSLARTGQQLIRSVLLSSEGLVEQSFIAQRVHSINDHRPLQTDRSGYQIACSLTREAFLLMTLMSSLGLWAVLWTTAASLASAWLQ